jgi:hypothetical protein
MTKVEICKDLWQNCAMLADREFARHEFALRLESDTGRDAFDEPLIREVLSKQEYTGVRNSLNWALDVIEAKGIDRVLRHRTVLGIFRTFLAIEKARNPYLTISLWEDIFLLLIPPINIAQNADRKVRSLETLLSKQKEDLMKRLPKRKANDAFIGALKEKTHKLCDIIRQGFEKETTENFINGPEGLKRLYLNWWQQQTLPTTDPFSPQARAV